MDDTVAAMRWKEAAAAKKQQIWARAAPEWRASINGIRLGQQHEAGTFQAVQNALPPAQRQITEWKSMDLLQALSRGDVTATEVVTAFSHRAMLAHHYVSAFAPFPC